LPFAAATAVGTVFDDPPPPPYPVIVPPGKAIVELTPDPPAAPELLLPAAPAPITILIGVEDTVLTGVVPVLIWPAPAPPPPYALGPTAPPPPPPPTITYSTVSLNPASVVKVPVVVKVWMVLLPKKLIAPPVAFAAAVSCAIW
jgi:hypothetical protein